jgi:predicted AAA+ superfamily ATPase
MQLDCILDDGGMMYLSRTLEASILKASRAFPVLLLSGPRQAGKTTLLKRLAKKRGFVSLDDLALRELAQHDPDLFLQRFPAPVLIDEVQYAPQLFSAIKKQVDAGGKAGDWWLTGSQPFRLMQGVSESLAGRVAVMELQGFSRRELLQKDAGVDAFLPLPKLLAARAGAGSLSLQSVFKLIWAGSLPKAALERSGNHDLFWSSYVQTYLQRDVRDLKSVGDPRSFHRFLRACAARTGGLLNMADLARDADISPNTAKAWLSVLEASCQILLLPAWHQNISKRLVSAPKLYMTDTGLAAHLCGWSTPEALAHGAMAGAFFETWALQEVIKSWSYRSRQARFAYYRDKDKLEIDLLIEVDQKLYPIEFKLSATPRTAWKDPFRALLRLKGALGPGAVLCLCKEAVPLSENITALPASCL